MKKQLTALLQRQYKGFAEQGDTKVYLTAVISAENHYIKVL